MPVEPAGKACDFCRSKKIKCNRQRPICQACGLYGVDCHYSARARRKAPLTTSESKSPTPFAHVQGDVKQDLSLSSERETTPVEERLTRIEKTVNSIFFLLSGKRESNKQTISTPFPSLISLINDAENLAQSRGRAPLGGIAPPTNTEAILPSQAPKFPNASAAIPEAGWARERVLVYFEKINWWWPIFHLQNFLTEFDNFYQNGCTGSHLWRASFNTILAFVVARQMVPSDDPRNAETLFANAWLFIQEPQFFLTPDIGKVQLLLVMTMYLAYQSRPGLSRSLSSQACLMALALNLHRKSIADPVTCEIRKRIFWMCYGMDKGITMVFGTPSIIHDRDWDCELPDPAYELEFGVVDGGDAVFRASIDLVIIQSQLWEKLYAVSGLGTEDNADTIQELHNKLVEFQRELPDEIALAPLQAPRDSRTSLLNFAGIEIHFSYYNLMIYLHRVNNTTESYSITLKSARDAIALMEKFMNVDADLTKKADPMWIFLYCPFTPFLIIFSHIISGKSVREEADIQLLNSVHEFFQKMRAVSDVAVRLATIAASFIRVARNMNSDSQVATDDAQMVNFTRWGVGGDFPINGGLNEQLNALPEAARQNFAWFDWNSWEELMV